MSTDATRAADQAAEAMRALNYATLPHEGAPGLEYPGDVYETVASLKVMVQRMPQAFRQLAAWLTEQDNAGKVGHDSGGSAVSDVAAVRYLLSEAEAAAGTLEMLLNEAHTASAHLTGVEP